MQQSVQLSHARVSREYYGSHAGWSTVELSKKLGEPHAVREGEPVELACGVKGCGAKLTFRLIPSKERKQLFWQAFKRNLKMLGIALTIPTLGALLEWVSHDFIVLKVVRFVLIVLGDLASVVFFLQLLFGCWADKYDLTYKDYGALQPGIQHGVTFL